MTLRVVHVGVVRPAGQPTPEQALAAWPTLSAVASAVAGAGADVTVVQAFHETAERRIGGVNYRFVAEPALPGRAAGLAPWRIGVAVRGCGPDVIHVNGLDFPAHIRALCGHGVPVLAQDHASVAGRRAGLRKWGLARVAGVLFTDERQAEPFFADGSFRPGLPVFSVPESSSDFTPADQATARGETRLDGDPILLWIGRLDANKDPLTILAAVEIAAPVLTGLRLYCCFHEEPLLAQVKARIAASPLLRERVTLIGKVPHGRIEALCRSADFFVLSSHREGSGYALMEAMACGATPIVSDIPSFRRLTGNGAVGALVPAGDAEGFARALLGLAAQPRAEAREKTIAHFRQELSFDRVGTRLSEIYTAIAAEGR